MRSQELSSYAAQRWTPLSSGRTQGPAHTINSAHIKEGSGDLCEAAALSPHARTPHPYPAVISGKNESASFAIVGARTLRSKKRLNASQDVSDTRRQAWHAAPLMLAWTSG